MLDGAVSKATTTNPKDLMGAKKVALSAVPSVAIAHEACAMMDGEWKYGFRNWRDKAVIARIYVDAALRHINAWFEGEEVAADSGVHHLGHARACLGILLDAQATGNLIDNRIAGQYSQTAEHLSQWVVARQEYHAAAAGAATPLCDHELASLNDDGTSTYCIKCGKSFRKIYAGKKNSKNPGKPRRRKKSG